MMLQGSKCVMYSGMACDIQESSTSIESTACIVCSTRKRQCVLARVCRAASEHPADTNGTPEAAATEHPARLALVAAANASPAAVVLVAMMLPIADAY